MVPVPFLLARFVLKLCFEMATSVRKENRWRRQLYAQNSAVSDRLRELEVLAMARSPRSPVPPSSGVVTATRREVRRWMRVNAEEYEGATQLAEAVNAALVLPGNAMDDETHWVWEEAWRAAKQIDR